MDAKNASIKQNGEKLQWNWAGMASKQERQVKGQCWKKGAFFFGARINDASWLYYNLIKFYNGDTWNFK